MTDEQIRELADSLKEDLEAVKGYVIEDKADLDLVQEALASCGRKYWDVQTEATATDIRADHERYACLYDALVALAVLRRTLQQAVRHYEEAQQRPVEWRVVRIAWDMLPDEYLVPDRERIDAVANAARGNPDPPIIPGVIFERKHP